MTRRFGAAALAAVLLLALLAEAAAFWPGLMTWDAAREYDQALSGAIDDWHPPTMIWLWRWLLPIAHGPAPMLIVQLALYFGGWALLAGWAWRRDRSRLAIALSACALFPIALALQAAVLKDCLLAGALLGAAGLIATRKPASRATAAVLLVAATTLRFNGFLACLPLLMALPDHWRGGRRSVLAWIAGAGVLLAATPVANRLIGAAPSGVEMSQIAFDLGGITYFSGADAFPPVGVADPVRVNHGCYRPDLWDPYSWWVDAPCPIGFANIRAALRARGESGYGWWLTAILHHPVAYAEHRLAHANRNLRLLVADAPVQVVPELPELSRWGYEVRANPVSTAIARVAAWQARTPLGWPAWWLAVAAGLLILAPRLASRRIVAPLATSALLYGAGYLALSVASDLRYHLWTMLGALAAAVIAADDIAAGARPSRRRAVLAVVPVLGVTVAGALARALLAS